MIDKLQAIIKRIDASKLKDEEKLDIFEEISDGLHRVVWPVLIKYMPKDQLDDLSIHPEKITIESYSKLIEDTIKDPQIFQEFGKLIDKTLIGIDAILTKNGIK
jgi:hypothetical protein